MRPRPSITSGNLRFIDDSTRSLQPLLADATRALLAEPGDRAANDANGSIACFVDLARFTTISEALGKIGSAGTEQLVALINRFFTPAIDTAYTAGGDVVGFGGDALTVLFPFEALDQACTWARGVMSLVDEVDVIDTPSGQFRLEAKIGIGQGTQRTHLVGGGGNRQAVTGGTAIDNAVLAEGRVDPGDIGLLIDEQQLPPHLIDQPGITLLDGAPPRADQATAGLRSDSPAVDIADETVLGFVPDRVVERITTTGPELLDEHRPVTVLFVSVGDEPIHVEPAVIPYLQTAMAIVDAHRGSVLSIGSGDKGTTLLAAFGAPVAFAGQRSAAVFAASEITEAIPSTCGVATGLCFSGRVGSARRWSYTLIGDVVNTAARLMARAGQRSVLVDEPTYHATDSALVFDPATDERLKGKETPVRAALLRSTGGETGIGNDLPLAGRDDELRTLSDRLEDLVLGSGSASLVVGESGVGKSRLARELVEIALGRGFRIAEVGLMNRRSARSYGPWQPVVFSVLGLAEDVGPAEFRAAVFDRFGPESPLASILAHAVGGGEPSPELAGIETKQAADIIDAAFADLVLHDGERPLLLIADDAHDLDEASTRLLDRIRQRASKAAVALIAIGYPNEQIARWGWDSQIDLTDLTPPAAFELALDHQRKSGLDLDEAALHEIVDRVGGNPQLLRLLVDFAASGASDLPNDVRSIVMARYDRLPGRTREALAMASVLGRHFSRGDFLGAFDDRLTNGRPTLDELAAEGLVEQVGHDSFSFASPVLWQVAYEASSYASRSQAHRDVGHHIERLPSARADQRVEDLAHHFSYTEDLARHRRYFGPAGRRAQRSFANEKAVEWFRRAIDIADDAAVAGLRFDLATTLEHIGRLDEATSELTAASDDRTVGPKALASLAQLQLLTDNFELAAQTLDRAMNESERLNDTAVTEWVFEKASLVHTHAGRYERAAELAATQLDAAERTGDRLRIAAALSNSGAAKSWIGDLAPARAELTQSLGIFIDLGALGMAADTEMDLAMVALDEGNVEECLQRLRTTHDRAKSIGHRRVEASATGNLALALLGEGETEQAWAPAMSSATLLLEIGDVATASGTFGLLGVLTMTGGDFLSTIGIVARTVHIGRRLGSSAYRERAYGVLIDAYEELGDTENAQRCREQQSVDEESVSEEAVNAVAPLVAPDEMTVSGELANLLFAADELIAGLGVDNDRR